MNESAQDPTGAPAPGERTVYQLTDAEAALLNTVREQARETEWQLKFETVEIFDGRGKFNRYTCEACRFTILTTDIHKGVTPFMIQCRREELTGIPCVSGSIKDSQARIAVMSSSFGRAPENSPQFHPKPRADYEWYRPTLREVATFDLATRDHVENGGLLMRRARDEYDQCGSSGRGCGHVRMRHTVRAEVEPGGLRLGEAACDVKDCRCEAFVEPPIARTFTCASRQGRPGPAVPPDRFGDYWSEQHWPPLYLAQWPEGHPKPRVCSFCGGVNEEDLIKLVDAGWKVGDVSRSNPFKAELYPPEGAELPTPPVTLRAHHIKPDLFLKLRDEYKEDGHADLRAPGMPPIDHGAH